MSECRQPFVMIPAALISDPDMGSVAVRVYGALRAFGDTPETCYPSVARLAEAIGASPASVKRALPPLESAGWITRVQRFTGGGLKTSNGYEIHDAPLGRQRPNDGSPATQQDAKKPRSQDGSPATQRRVGNEPTMGHQRPDDDPPATQQKQQNPRPPDGPEMNQRWVTSDPTDGSKTTHELDPFNKKRTTTSFPTTPTGGSGQQQQQPKITPRRILTEMARRQLQLGRDTSADWAPPEGCGPRREQAFLRTQYRLLQERHGLELDALIARLKPDQPQPHKPHRNDPDYYVWKLNSDLARRDWLQPTAEETRAKHDRERADYQAELERDPEGIAAARARAQAFGQQLRRDNTLRAAGIDPDNVRRPA